MANGTRCLWPLVQWLKMSGQKSLQFSWTQDGCFSPSYHADIPGGEKQDWVYFPVDSASFKNLCDSSIQWFLLAGCLLHSLQDKCSILPGYISTLNKISVLVLRGMDIGRQLVCLRLPTVWKEDWLFFTLNF